MASTHPAPVKYRPPVPKAQCFKLDAPKDASVDDIIDAIEDVVGPHGLKGLQHQGGMKFCAAVSSAAAAKTLNERGAIVVNGTSCPVTCIGPQIINVTVYRFQWYMNDQDLGAALSPYGRVLSVHYPSFNGRPRIENGVRLVRIEMKSPVPNFLSVRGYKVQCEYRGVKRVCSRCEREGHNRSDCKTPWCPRCETFGHEFETCSAVCRRCHGDHATADCLRPRSYAAAASEFPELSRNTNEIPQVTLARRQTPPDDIPSSASSSSDGDSQATIIDETLREDIATTPTPAQDTSSSDELTGQPNEETAGNSYSSSNEASLSPPSSTDIDTEESGSADSRSQLPSSHPVDPAPIPATKPRGARNRGLRGSFIDEDAKPVRREASKPYRRDATASGPSGGPSRHPDDISLPINIPNSNEPACPTQAKDPRLVNPINQVEDLMDTSRVESKRVLSSSTDSDDVADASKKLRLPAPSASPDL